MDTNFKDIPKEAIIYLSITFGGFLVLYWIVLFIMRKLGKNPKYLLPEGVMKRAAFPIFLIFVSNSNWLFLLYLVSLLF